MTLQVCVKAFLQNTDGAYLLLKRNVETYPETAHCPWDIVGGRIEVGSTLLENLAREIREETGLALTATPRLVHAQDILRGTEKHVVRLTYTAPITGTPVLDPKESAAYTWVLPEALESFEGLDTYAQEVVALGLL